MTIYTIKDLLRAAGYLPGKYAESMKLNLEDVQEQLQIWMKTPEKLSKDESTHAGIKLLAKTMLGEKG